MFCWFLGIVYLVLSLTLHLNDSKVNLTAFQHFKLNKFHIFYQICIIFYDFYLFHEIKVYVRDLTNISIMLRVITLFT